jgi:hypothetical protein
MSNHTPASIRAKDKERKAQEKHPKQIRKERKARLSSGAKRVISVLGTILAILTAFSTVQSFFTRLNISQNGTVRSHDAMGTVFNLTNNGILPVFDVEPICHVDITSARGQPILSNLGIGMRPLGYLGSGETKSLECHHAASNFDTDTSMTIVINYRTLLWFWTGTKMFPVKAEKTDDGTWVWKSE